MGRIKSTMIKKAAKQLLEREHTFNGEFVHNKQLLRSTMPSKPIENKVAGYITRLVRMRAKEKAKLAAAEAAAKAHATTAAIQVQEDIQAEVYTTTA